MGTTSSGPVERLFALVARGRRAPAFHPVGRSVTGHLDLSDGFLGLPAGRHPVLVRLSKGAGTPGSVPDALGLGVRIDPEAADPVDLLATSTASVPGLRRVLLPSSGWAGTQLDSLMYYRRGRVVRWVRFLVHRDAARSNRPDAAALSVPFEVTVQEVDIRGRVHASGRMRLDRASGLTEADLALDPVRQHPPGWRLGPAWLARLRASAYVGSREGRPLAE